ncbi:protein unc-13 homolog 4B-like isoform X2 [Chironomus tepperi]|uniref:protein unc-13 homolog 4B-like isoform X2 n=1 Tax=Chironomus tepperi TaxID=113505 RepID=UPI00391F2033
MKNLIYNILKLQNALKILSNHANSKDLQESYISLAKWIAYIEVHQNYPLNLENFHILLDNIVETQEYARESPLQSSQRISSFTKLFKFFDNTKNGTSESVMKGQEEIHLKVKEEKIIKLFWDSTRKLKFYFLNFIFELPSNRSDNENIKNNLRNIFEVVVKIDKISNSLDQMDFQEHIKKSLTNGTIEHFMKNVNQKLLKQAKHNEQKLNQLIKLIQFVQKNFKQFVEDYGQIFASYANTSLSELLYITYDSQLVNVIKPIVLDINKTRDGNIEYFQKSTEAVSTKLFQLYCELKNFSDYGMEISGNCDFKTKEYFSWFSHGVETRSNSFTLFAAKARIEKSINADSLSSSTEDKKYSKSAPEVAKILNLINDFWENLDDKYYENKEDELAKLVSGDVCRFLIIYFEKMIKKMQSSRFTIAYVNSFKIPSELSTVIANMSYVWEEVQILIGELINKNLPTSNNAKKILQNTLKYMKQLIQTLLRSTLEKCVPSIKKLMIESAEDYNSSDSECDKLTIYIEATVISLQNFLPSREYETSKAILWDNVLEIITEVIEKLSHNMSPKFFSNLNKLFVKLKPMFKSNQYEIQLKVESIDNLLEHHGFNTSRLIHDYYKSRYEMQKQIESSYIHLYGTLSINCYFSENTLSLEILNTKDILPNKKHELVVTVNIIPEKSFRAYQHTKLKVYEKLEFKMTQEQRSIKDAIILFYVEEKVLFGNKECIGEAFLAFKDIPECEKEPSNDRISLTLTRIYGGEIESLKEIEQRSQNGDKEAKEFLTKLKPKMLTMSRKSKNLVTEL